MKKIKALVFVLFTVIILSTLTSCDTSIRDAKKAYKQGDYSKVVELIENNKDLDEEMNQVLLVSKANIAYSKMEYTGVIKNLSQSSDGKSMDIYKNSVKAIVDTYIESMNDTPLKEVINLDESIGNEIADKIESGCNSLDYSYYQKLDKVIKSFGDLSFGKKLSEYRDNNKTQRAKSFMVGEWEWQSDIEVKTRINNILVDKELMGTVTQVGDNEKEYQICLNDIYWKDFVFIDETTFKCNNLCKTTDGYGVDVTAIGKINFAKDSVSLHLTAPAPYFLENADRNFKRVN